MSCPTCDHTMQSLGVDAQQAKRFYWCPRCGTIKTVITSCNDEIDDCPKLVERCREYAESDCLLDKFARHWWKTMGIAESINLPADRPLN